MQVESLKKERARLDSRVKQVIDTHWTLQLENDRLAEKVKTFKKIFFVHDSRGRLSQSGWSWRRS